MRHQVFGTLEEFCEAISDKDFTADNYYFCISTLKSPTIEDRGKQRIRTQKNAALTRVMVLDIDIKDGHFPDFDAAVATVNEFAKDAKIPQPIIVNSGYGAHVYWPFIAGISSEEWVPIARQFKNYLSLTYPALVADGTRVADSAGVLRIPDSFNLKYDKQTPVTIYQWYSDVLDVSKLKKVIGYDTAKPSSKTKAKPTLSLPDTADTVAFADVVKRCNWVKQYVTHVKTESEPSWYAVLGLAPYMEHKTVEGVVEGESLAQVLSKGHDDYSPETTAKKYQQVKAAQSGPTTCERFATINASRCEGCPFASRIKTPLQAGRLDRPAEKAETKQTVVMDDDGNKETQTVTVPLYPSPYFRGEEGGVYVRAKAKDDDGTWEETIERVYDYDLYPVKRYRTEQLESELMEVHLWLPHDGLRTFKLPTSLLAEQKKLAVFLAEKGVVGEYNKGGRIARYMVDYVRHMQAEGAAEVEFSRFGWRDAKTVHPKFVVGNGYIDTTGELVPASFAHFLKDAARTVATAGNIEQWKEGFDIYNHIPDSEPFILASLMGFAAPLMALTPYKGVLYNMVGESAAGKSTALRVMTSVWGQPNETHVDTRDNEIPIYNFIGYLNAVPVAMDELTHMEPDKISRFTLSFTSGRGKMRANRDGTNKLNETEWETIVVGTSNTSLYDKLAANRKGYTAEAMRIFETNLDASHPQYKQVAERHLRLLNNNYGHAGRLYMSKVIGALPAIQQKVEEATAAITKAGNLRNEERFWAAMFACVLVGGKISKALGLHNYDVEGLVKHFTKGSEQVREAVRISQTDPASVMSDFLLSNLDAILKFTHDDKPYLGPDGRDLSYLRSVKVRMQLDEQGVPEKAWVSIPALREYCASKKVDPSWLVRELTQKEIMYKGSFNKRLTSGTGLAGSPSIKCYIIDMKNAELQGLHHELT